MALQLRLFFVLLLVAASFCEAQMASSSGAVDSNPDGATTAKPDGATTAKPDGATTAKPDGATTANPDGATTAKPDGATTAKPDGATTAKPDGATTVKPDGATTAKPDGATTPKPDGATTPNPDGATTPKPDGATTAKPDGATTPKPDGATTPNPDGATTPKPDGATTPKPDGATTPNDPCMLMPCGGGSTCQRLANQTRVCLCLLGDVYNYASHVCEKGKVFPGYLSVPKIKYTEALKEKTSEDFLRESLKVVAVLDDVFKGKDYHGSSVLEFNKISDVQSRSEAGVVATVELIFESNAQIDTKTVEEKIEKHIESGDNILSGGSFGGETLCKLGSCDEVSTNCTPGEGSFKCVCKSGYGEVSYSDRICKGCPSGQKLVDGSCTKCDFGFSGFNCKEYWKLVVVILGTLFGVILITALILLPIAILNSSKKSKKPKKSKIEEKASWDSKSRGAAADAFARAGMPRIPRAMVNGNWDRKTNLEMTQSSSQQNLSQRMYEDHDDMAPYSTSKSNLYGQTRAQTNPYASSQGQTNPYYTHDGRRFP